MKNDRLLNAMGQIDEQYILEAAPNKNGLEPRKQKMKTNRRTTFFRKPAAVAAALVLCVCLSGVTAIAATGGLHGYFEDVLNWNGAVVGTSYEQASDEIAMNITEVNHQLVVELVMLYPDNVPYSKFEMLGIESYNIVDADNKIIAKGTTTELTEIADGKASVCIQLDDVPSGNYKLIVSEMVGDKKADQPLILSGSWECDFTR